MTKQSIIVRSDFKLSLNNVDRNKYTINSDKKILNKMLDYYSDDEKRVMNMIDYFTGKINKHDNINLVLENGKYATKEELEKRKKYINKQFKNSNVWRLVISVDKDLVNNNMKWKDLEEQLAKKILPRFFKKMGFEDAKKMCYQFSLHMNTDHPHFHVAFMERVPNTINSNNQLMFRRKGEIPIDAIKYLMNEMIITIERNSKFTPKSIDINNDIAELKRYFNPQDKNFVLYDKKNILLEEKILLLGNKLNEIQREKGRLIKYNSINDKDIKRLTKEIKKDIYNLYPNLADLKKEFKNSINNMNKYLIDVASRNSNKMIDVTYTKNKKEYLDNYILNSIVNYSNKHYIKENSKIINSNDIFQSIILNVYRNNREITKKDIIKNSFNNNYQLSSEVISAIKNINREMDKAAEEFYKMNDLIK
jgi:hypothetical protein